MSELKTKFITADDFKEYFGIDLKSELESDDNPSNQVNAFLLRTENRMRAFINAKFHKNIDNEYDRFTDYQKYHYKLALLEQSYYVFQNGDISSDSGYDMEKGETASNRTITSKIISPNAKQELINCGIWNREIGGSRNGFFYY